MAHNQKAMSTGVPLSPAALNQFSDRFFAYMNARDYPAAADLYAPDAVYQSPALPGDGQLTGREEIMAYFKAALEDSDFQLAIVHQFAGVNMSVTMSTDGAATFVDVLRVNDQGQIIEHLEVTPQLSDPVS